MPFSAAPDAIVKEMVRFAGPFRLEGELVYPETAAPHGAVVIAGPHPLLGGDMHNNVVRGVADELAGRGLAALRFNYRGVGGSTGPAVDVADTLARFWQTSHLPDELELVADLDAAVAFLRDALPAGVALAAIGYSFGCALLPRVHAVEELDALILIAPTITKHNYDPFLRTTPPLLVIAPEDDFAVDAEELRRWCEQLSEPKQIVSTRRDGHFFRGHEVWLAETIFAFLNARWR